MRQKKILHLIPISTYGGAPINVLRYIKHDTEFKHVVAMRKGEEELFNEYIRANIDIKDLGINIISINTLFSLIKIIKDENVDIIVANGKGPSLYALLLSIILLKPFKVVSVFRGYHNKFIGMKFYLYNLFEKIFTLVVDQYICVSTSEYNKVIETNIYPLKKLNIIPNGIEVIKLNLGTELYERLLKYDKNIVTLSRISPQKDIITLLNAFDSIVKNSDLKIALYIIGGTVGSDMEYNEHVKKYFESLDAKTKENIFFLGGISNAGNYLHNFDLYLSTALWEGLPTAIIEAMLQKIVVVGTDVIGNDEVIGKDYGFLVEAKDYKSISQMVIDVLDKDNTNMILKAYEHSVSMYSIENNIKKTNQLYKKL